MLLTKDILPGFDYYKPRIFYGEVRIEDVIYPTVTDQPNPESVIESLPSVLKLKDEDKYVLMIGSMHSAVSFNKIVGTLTDDQRSIIKCKIYEFDIDRSSLSEKVSNNIGVYPILDNIYVSQSYPDITIGEPYKVPTNEDEVEGDDPFAVVEAAEHGAKASLIEAIVIGTIKNPTKFPQVPMLQGHTGIAKSSIVQKVVKTLDQAKDNTYGYRLVTIMVGFIDKMDILGFVTIRESKGAKVMEFAPMEELATAEDSFVQSCRETLDNTSMPTSDTPAEEISAYEKLVHYSKTPVIFLDEINRTGEEIYQVLTKLLNEKEIEMFKFHDARIICAANVPIDEFGHLDEDSDVALYNYKDISDVATLSRIRSYSVTIKDMEDSFRNNYKTGRENVATISGNWKSQVKIGKAVKKGQVLGTVGDIDIIADKASIVSSVYRDGKVSPGVPLVNMSWVISEFLDKLSTAQLHSVTKEVEANTTFRTWEYLERYVNWLSDHKVSPYRRLVVGFGLDMDVVGMEKNFFDLCKSKGIPNNWLDEPDDAMQAFIDHCTGAGIPTMLLGRFGLGKTSRIKQSAEARDSIVLPIDLSTADRTLVKGAPTPTDVCDVIFKGLPETDIHTKLKKTFSENAKVPLRTTTFTPSLSVVDKIKEAKESGKELIIVFDEFNRCLSGDTKLRLLDNRVLTLKEIDEEFGKDEFYVFACKSDGTVIPAKAYSQGVTRKNAELLRIHLDNGEYIDATPDHRFMLRDGEYVEAQYLRENQSLMPFVYNEGLEANDFFVGYPKVLNNKTDKYELVHQLVVWEFLGGYSGDQIGHHKDFTPSNNLPENIELMTREEHRILHKGFTQEAIRAIKRKRETDKDFDEYMTKCSLENLKLTQTPEAKERARLGGIEFRKNNPELAFEMCSKGGISVHERHPDLIHRTILADKSKKKATKSSVHTRRTSEEFSKLRSKLSTEMWTPEWQEAQSKRCTNQLISFGLIKIIKTVIKYFYSDGYTVADLTKDLYVKYRDQYYKTRECKRGGLVVPSLDWVNKRFNSWDEFVSQLSLSISPQFNHKIIRIEKLSDRQDAYDITVPGYNNFGLESGIFVHNCEPIVQSAVFSAISDLQLYGEKLDPEMTRFFCAGNVAGDDMPVNVEAIDAATVARFALYRQDELTDKDVEIFLNYARKNFNSYVVEAMEDMSREALMSLMSEVPEDPRMGCNIACTRSFETISKLIDSDELFMGKTPSSSVSTDQDDISMYCFDYPGTLIVDGQVVNYADIPKVWAENTASRSEILPFLDDIAETISGYRNTVLLANFSTSTNSLSLVEKLTNNLQKLVAGSWLEKYKDVSSSDVSSSYVQALLISLRWANNKKLVKSTEEFVSGLHEIMNSDPINFVGATRQVFLDVVADMVFEDTDLMSTIEEENQDETSNAINKLFSV